MNYHDISTLIVSFVSYKPTWLGAAPKKGVVSESPGFSGYGRAALRSSTVELGSYPPVMTNGLPWLNDGPNRNS